MDLGAKPAHSPGGSLVKIGGSRFRIPIGGTGNLRERIPGPNKEDAREACSI
jgi:hypothetical protein